MHKNFTRADTLGEILYFFDNMIRKILKFLLPDTIFQKMKEESKIWTIGCDCGYNISVWDAGGIRYKAIRLSGTKRIWGRCPNCKKWKFFSVIRKV
jgi:hypothetical protein